MPPVLTESGRDLIFRNARTHKYWLDVPVSDATLRELYDLMKWGPTSANMSPIRIVFLRTREAKERLRPTLSPGNVDKTMTAPVTAILAYDYNFALKLPKLFPHNLKVSESFRTAETIAANADRNGALQAGYLILAARAVGLDCGPMTGFNAVKVNEEFFPAGQSLLPGSDLRADILCNLGYGDRTRLSPRNPRLEFDEACVLL